MRKAFGFFAKSYTGAGAEAAGGRGKEEPDGVLYADWSNQRRREVRRCVNVVVTLR